MGDQGSAGELYGGAGIDDRSLRIVMCGLSLLDFDVTNRHRCPSQMRRISFRTDRRGGRAMRRVLFAPGCPRSEALGVGAFESPSVLGEAAAQSSIHSTSVGRDSVRANSSTHDIALYHVDEHQPGQRDRVAGAAVRELDLVGHVEHTGVGLISGEAFADPVVDHRVGMAHQQVERTDTARRLMQSESDCRRRSAQT